MAQNTTQDDDLIKGSFELSEEEAFNPAPYTQPVENDPEMARLTGATQYYKGLGFNGDNNNETLARILGRSQIAAEDTKDKADKSKRGLFQSTFIDPYIYKGESEEQKKRNKNKRMIAAIGDGLTALANFAGTVGGANPIGNYTTMSSAISAQEAKDRKERMDQAKIAQQSLARLESDYRKAEQAAQTAEKEHNRNVLNALTIQSNKDKQDVQEEHWNKEFDNKVTYQTANMEMKKTMLDEMKKRNDAYIKNLLRPRRSSGGGGGGRSGRMTDKQRRDYDNATWYGQMWAKNPARMAEVMGDRTNWRTGVIKHPSSSSDYATIRAQYETKYPRHKIR